MGRFPPLGPVGIHSHSISLLDVSTDGSEHTSSPSFVTVHPESSPLPNIPAAHALTVAPIIKSYCYTDDEPAHGDLPAYFHDHNMGQDRSRGIVNSLKFQTETLPEPQPRV